MPYGKASLDTIETSGSLTITGNVIVSGQGTVSPLVLGTAQASTSGTEIIFTGIPSWVKRITVAMDGISSTTGAGNFLVRLGSGSIVSTGYWGMNFSVSTTTTNTGTITDGIFAGSTGNSGSSILYSLMTLVLVDTSTNTWLGTSIAARDDTNDVMHNGAGRISLSGILDRLSVVTSVGTFDAGKINIMYE